MPKQLPPIVSYHLKRGPNREHRRAWRAFQAIIQLLEFKCPPAFRRTVVRQLALRYAHSDEELQGWLNGGADAEAEFFDSIEAEADNVDALGPRCGMCELPFKRPAPTVVLVTPEAIEDMDEWSRDARAARGERQLA